MLIVGEIPDFGKVVLAFYCTCQEEGSDVGWKQDLPFWPVCLVFRKAGVSHCNVGVLVIPL